MPVARLIRSAAATAVVAVCSTVAFGAFAQSGYDDSSGQSTTPMNTERGSGASDRSRDRVSTPADSQGGNVRSGTDTGQDRATPGIGGSGRGSPSVPYCPTMPPNAAECPPEGR